MNDRRDFHEDTQRWLDGVPGTSPHAEDRAAAERLREAGDQFARSLDVPGPEVDAVVMAAVRRRSSPPVAARTSWWNWLIAPRTVRIRPAFAVLAAAAVIALLVVTQPRATLGPDAGVASGQVLVRFELPAPAASRVTLAGTFNEWSPEEVDLTLNPVTGVWSVTLPMQPGEHQYLFVIDGEQWLPDPAAHAQVDDGFGQRNSLLVVAAEEARS